MPKEITTENKKKIFVSVPLENEEEKLAIRILAAKKNQSMAEYIRGLIHADLKQHPARAGAGQ